MNKGGAPGEWLYETKEDNPGSQFYGFQRWTCQVIDRAEESIFPLAPLSTVAGEDVLQKYRTAMIPGKDFLISTYYKTVFREAVYFEEENKLRVLSERIGGQRTPFYIFEIWAENNIIYHKIVGSYGKTKQKDIEEAMRDLSKYNRQEWKYTKNKPQPQVNAASFISEQPTFHMPEYTPIETKDYFPAENIEQRNWKTPTEFPICPAGLPDNALEAYKDKMVINGIFCRNRYGESILKDVGYNIDHDVLIVLTYQPGSIKKWYLSAIYIENDIYIHEALGSYFDEDGGRKYFTIHTGGEWTGGDVMDDFC